METFSQPKDFTSHPTYSFDRGKALSGLRIDKIDPPLRDIVLALNELPYCFTVQCCYGHFTWNGQSDPHNMAMLPSDDPGKIRYRIAYLAVCIEEGSRGVTLRDKLAGLCEIDKRNIQFGSPRWFWDQYPNTYSLQVEPARFAMQDQAILDHKEALQVQGIREVFFKELRKVISD